MYLHKIHRRKEVHYMKRYLIKVTATAKETNDKRPGEIHTYFLIKGGYVRNQEDLFNEDGTFKNWFKNDLYSRKWIAEKEASKVDDESWWYKSAELVEVDC